MSHWYYLLPDYVLAVLMYTMIGRVLLSLVIDEDSKNYVWRFFCRITDPVVAVVRVLTPKAAPAIIVWLFAVVWLFWLRFGLNAAAKVFGVIPLTM
jgi:YggT family protein